MGRVHVHTSNGLNAVNDATRRAQSNGQAGQSHRVADTCSCVELHRRIKINCSMHERELSSSLFK